MRAFIIFSWLLAAITAMMVFWLIFYTFRHVPWYTVDEWLTSTPDRTEVLIYALAAVFTAWRRNA